MAHVQACDDCTKKVLLQKFPILMYLGFFFFFLFLFLGFHCPNLITTLAPHEWNELKHCASYIFYIVPFLCQQVGIDAYAWLHKGGTIRNLSCSICFACDGSYFSNFDKCVLVFCGLCCVDFSALNYWSYFQLKETFCWEWITYGFPLVVLQ